jgi:2,3-bisphosphoglycerate-independent phosphoglycerate mutase
MSREVKYLCIVPDGLADRPIPELGGRTPMEAAATPNLDRWARGARIGLVQNVPDGFAPGSDVAIMSICGLDPRLYYSGRAPIEAAAMGIELGGDEVAYRCNFVTVENGIMKDFSAGHITSEESASLISSLNDAFASEEVRFFAGVSYRNICVLPDKYAEAKCTPPHDLTDKPIQLPEGPAADKLVEIMERSSQVLADHPVNVERRKQGKPAATQVWLWGQGKTPKVPGFGERYGLTGALITAVDLVRGLAVLTGLEIVEVPGATGYYDTNYQGKAQYALEALERVDFCLVHIEATDEAGHEGSFERKIEAYEAIDRMVVGTIQEGMQGRPYKVLVLPDHPTPVSVKTHTPEPVPFMLFDSRSAPTASSNERRFTESEAAAAGGVPEEGHTLLSVLFEA